MAFIQQNVQLPSTVSIASSPICQPLEPESETIRVLELLPRVLESDLGVVTRTAALDDKQFYDALS
ncbi:hypothetical protein GGR58DRAFT_496671 [Xylaria digitata]|nr:hypothetical protein GGR58DRAFT_496671 [Xylaria digitata]